MAKSSRSQKYLKRADTYLVLDTMHKRVNKMCISLGIPQDPKSYVYFDLALLSVPQGERRKILKQIFSRWGTDIKLEHEPYLLTLEKFTKKVLEGFE